MFYFYKQSIIPPCPILDDGIEIRETVPSPWVPDMHQMQIGKKKYYYYQLMTFICRGFKRIFKEYDVVINDRVVSKAVLISKVPIYKFLPTNGTHICYCETIPESRGKGYYPLLLSYILNDMPGEEFYMIVDENNIPIIKGILKAGFVKYATGVKRKDGTFVLNKN